MEYKTSELKAFGSLTELTLGNGGSCLDGTGLNNQVGGGLQDQGPPQPGTCGASG
ncbi:MAG: hypothetical protein QOG49_441 [Frankiaceae bacterium]|jgi:hypothetical protein|nr:hypothetical protein [Frankiaceae bacterium]